VNDKPAIPARGGRAKITDITLRIRIKLLFLMILSFQTVRNFSILGRNGARQLPVRAQSARRAPAAERVAQRHRRKFAAVNLQAG
jgi:hypothetical protein